MEENDNEINVEVKFIAGKKLDPKYKITETPIRLPIKLARFGLSGIINHLLQLSK